MIRFPADEGGDPRTEPDGSTLLALASTDHAERILVPAVWTSGFHGRNREESDAGTRQATTPSGHENNKVCLWRLREEAPFTAS